MLNPNYKMDTLCRLFGNSRQAYYEREHYTIRQHFKEDTIISLVRSVREDFPRMGCKKLLVFLQARLKQAGVEIGWDAFVELMGRQPTVGKTSAGRKTTFSGHWLRKYPNLIKDYIPSAPGQLWVSDITHIELENRYLYLSLITNAYSRKIVGWSLSHTLNASYTVDTLRMALKTLPESHSGLIHHSNRGVQNCCSDYIKELTVHNIQISMTESGDPLENAIAERVNGVLKTEWLNKIPVRSPKETLLYIEKIITLYNEQRPHQSIGYQTPSKVHASSMNVERKWKNYYSVREKNKTSANFVP